MAKPIIVVSPNTKKFQITLLFHDFINEITLVILRYLCKD